MARNRLDLQALLESLPGIEKVYFQPPENTKLIYPCIIYTFDKFGTEKADNIDYLRRRRYELTLIHRDPDNDLVEKIQDLFYCNLDRSFKNENLYHYAFTIFY